MNANNYINTGDSHDFVPQADTARQAVQALRGYAYQCMAAALEWVDMSENGRLYLEVAEDYAILADSALRATQVKDTKKSGVVTLNNAGVRQAINAFVELDENNPDINIDLHFMTTSEIGEEKTHANRPAGKAGLIYWGEVAAGADVRPLRAILESGKFDETVSSYCKARDDEELRDTLIRKIHWNCGKPDYAALREELESRLIVIGRDCFQIPAEAARGLVDKLIYRVLATSIFDDSERRFLTRANFYELIDKETRISIRSADLDSLLSRMSELVRSIGEQSEVSIIGSAAHTDLFIDGDTLPVLQQMIPRLDLETSISYALSEFGVCILAGGSGVGKSVVVRRIAAQTGSKFFIVDCRDLETVETHAQLKSVFSRVCGLPRSTLILENLNHLDDPKVSFVFGQLAESEKRRGHKLIVTCYSQPSLSRLSGIGLDQSCVVVCPYFTEEEARVLVEACKGDSEIWGEIAFLAGQSGHPQLTHAFVVGMSGRGWPIDEISDVINSGLSSEDTDAVRSSVRHNLRRDLSDDTRNLLYRLSIVVGYFKMSFALSIASISPEVSQPGECMDQLVGPWVEASGNDRYRISPLASGIGLNMITLEDQKRIHKTIAEEYFKQGEIDAFDVNSVTNHALAAEWSSGLAEIAKMVLLSDSRALSELAEHAMLIRYFRTGGPIYPNDRYVSTILRLAQFSLALETEQQNDVSRIVATLFNEIDALPSGETKENLEVFAVLKLIATLGIAKHVDNWVSLLTRSIRIVEKNEFVRGKVAELEGVTAGDNSKLFGLMFCVGSSNLTSVEQLENIIEQLDVIDNRSRDLLLTPIDKGSSDYSEFINMPLATEGHSEDFDAEDAEVRYARMAEKTGNWGKKSLTSQCWVARSILLNEYLNNKEHAHSVLREAVKILGQNPILDRAQAKVYWHQGEYKSALEIYRNIAEHIGEDSPVERTFALREAAVSAANCSEWLLAEKWFLEGQRAAACLDSNSMNVMAIGLGADAAAAVLRAGDTGRALTGFVNSVDTLTKIDLDDSLATAYCHRVVRHAVRWVQFFIEGTLGEASGQTIILEPGTCSNPDPPPAIQELPLTHIDCTWYELAQSEVLANADVGINTSLYNRLTEGEIPQLEFGLRIRVIQKNIISLNANGFAEHLTKFIETTVHYSKNRQYLLSTFDAVAPKRENIPTLDSYTLVEPMVEEVAREAVLGYGIHSIMVDESVAILELETALIDYFGNTFPGKSVFDYLNNELSSLTEQDHIVAEIIKNYLRNGNFAPYGFCLAGLRFFEWINQSRFRDSLMLPLAVWQRSGWNRILKRQKFQIYNPSITVPPVVNCLENSGNDRSFVVELLLVSTDAAGVQLASEYREYLITMKES